MTDFHIDSPQMLNSEISEVKEIKNLNSLLEMANSRPSLRPSQDFFNGKLFYGVKIGEKRVLLCSDGSSVHWDQAKEKFRLLDDNFWRGKFSPTGIKRFIDGENISPQKIFDGLSRFFRRFIVYTDANIPGVLALWVMGTYLYMVFQWYGYIWINSPTKRSGKSKLLSLLEQTAFNSTSCTVAASDAWLFREASANGSTLIIDEIENLRNKEKDKFGMTMSLLNAGFKYGAVVPRMEPNGKTYKTVEYQVYSPKCLAGISQLADTIRDRCIKIPLLRKKPSEIIADFRIRELDSDLVRLRDELHIFGLQYAGQVSKIYEHSENLPVPNQIDDRAKDIFEPLFAIAQIVDETRDDKTLQATELLQNFCLVQAGIRSDSEQEDGTIPALVSVLLGIDYEETEKTILTPDKVLDLIRMSEDLSWVDSKKKAGSLLRKLGLRSGTHRIGGEVVRGYLITKQQIEDLKERFLPTSTEGDSTVTTVTLDGEQPLTSPVTTHLVTEDFEDGF